MSRTSRKNRDNNKFIRAQVKTIPEREQAIEQNLERNRMREYSANINDALTYKMRVFAMKKSKMERERAKRFQQAIRKQMRRDANFSLEQQNQLTTDFLNTTNPCTIQEIENCKTKEDLRNLVVRRQPREQERVEAGGALNYLNEAYSFIINEEKMKSANKQKLTAMEKNKLALMYMEMRQEADIRNNLCEKYKVDPTAVERKRTKTQKAAELFIKDIEEAYQKRKEKEQDKTTRTNSPTKSPSNSSSPLAAVSSSRQRSGSKLSKVNSNESVVQSPPVIQVMPIQVRPMSVNQIKLKRKSEQRERHETARFNSALQKQSTTRDTKQLVHQSSAQLDGVYSQQISIKGREPNWFRNNREHVYSSGSEMNNSYSVSQSNLAPVMDGKKGRQLSQTSSQDKLFLNYGNFKESAPIPRGFKNSRLKTAQGQRGGTAQGINFRGRNQSNDHGQGQQKGAGGVDQQEITNNNYFGNGGGGPHRRTGSIGLAPTKGEFEIMKRLGEDAYSIMKSSNNAMRLSHPMMLTNKTSQQTKQQAFGFRKSRPITSTTKPTMTGVPTNAQSHLRLSKGSCSNTNNIDETIGNSYNDQSMLKRSATAEHGKRMMTGAGQYHAWRRPGSNLSTAAIFTTNGKTQQKVMGDGQAGSRVTFLPVSQDSKIPTLREEHRSRTKRSVQSKIKVIKEQCISALELEGDKTHVVDNSDLSAWQFPHGFLEHMEKTSFDINRTQCPSISESGQYENRTEIQKMQTNFVLREQTLENDSTPEVAKEGGRKSNDSSPDNTATQHQRLLQVVADSAVKAKSRTGAGSGINTHQGPTASNEQLLLTPPNKKNEQYVDKSKTKNLNIPSNPSQESLHEYIIYSETTKSIFKDKQAVKHHTHRGQLKIVDQQRAKQMTSNDSSYCKSPKRKNKGRHSSSQSSKQSDKLCQLNLKLEEVRRKQRIKRILAADLIQKGATAQMAESYVMSLDDSDLTRLKKTHMPEEDPRFKRDRRNSHMRQSMAKIDHGLVKSRTIPSHHKNGERKPANQDVKLQSVEEIDAQERKLMSNLGVLMDKMTEFEEKNQAYNIKRMEITKKAVAFQLERNKRRRDRNNIVLKSN